MLNIDKARKEKGVTLVDMADLLEVRYQTVSDKIQGKYPFTFEETIKLHKKFFSEYDLVYLFSEAVSTA
ncbi:helix-turn-helix domain-containing protein [Streptococcus phage SMP]|uniref:helix-turn-helix domain-containing protein n=1 Tax=Streptococcus phage SMP TaxID=413066 RepID=UPI0000E8D8E1|nr:helix-turn-helix transcriptional regulator [Streptococcus suis]YP_950561.1 helix-turn-helix domain-containing protein [Streptococcus phage SMP]ABK91892.1 unknown [Streptococcus phage SMP]MBS8025547.1 helix-turn-helix transcriptional regulator [Streptococcus suis]MDG4509664.1 helix-turn-helix domain-containing protein [Streptococcus suis]MDW8574983.1 helix-turn-helix transcriptional regulator [Streptococcus suis]MDW8589026.1 helix-turn-helix transcriptional regulator [Streptococcus suis]